MGRRRLPSGTRERALELVEFGYSSVGAARALGVSKTAVRSWVRMAGMRFHPSSPVNGRFRSNGLDLDVALPGPFSSKDHGHANRLDLHDRVVIMRGLASGDSLRKIARDLGVAPSTVSREVKRSLTDMGYSARYADRRAKEQAMRPKPGKLCEGSWLRDQVVGMLNEKYSPQQVSGRLRRAFPTDHTKQVSAETIYQALYVQGRGSLRDELRVSKALRSGRTTRRPRSKLPPRPGRPWLEGHHISQRPPQAQDRAVPGHWEGDLVLGKDHKSALITLVERHSRFVLVEKVSGFYNSHTVTEQLIEMMRGLPKHLRQSLTWDQGAEMAQHATFTLATDCQVFFCDPHSPWQRGSNENTNGLIRDFYPKGTDFRLIDDTDIAHMQYLLNIRPRATLEYATPAEVLNVALTN